MRERYGTSIVTTKQACRTANGSWAQFAPPVTLTIARSGSQLSVDVYQASPTSAGESFEIDGVELIDGSDTHNHSAAGGDR